MPDERFAGLPELAASLRALGSSRRTRHGAAVQPKFFALLLDARRAAARAATRNEVVLAFDGATLLHAMDAMTRDIAAGRFPARPPARRAFEAQLADVLDPLRSALARLSELAPAAAAEPTTESTAWDAWLAQLRVVFAAADAVWPALDAALANQGPHTAPGPGQ